MLGQSVSLCPGLQQVETAPAHWSGEPGEAAGQLPASDPSPEPPELPKAPSAAPYCPSEARQSTLNLQEEDCIQCNLHGASWVTDSPPVTVEQFLVEDGAVGTEEVYGVESLNGDRILGRDSTGEVRNNGF